MNPLLTFSGTRLARMIRAGEVTSLETVEAHIAHIQKVNPVLNAVVRDRFEEARAEARRADAKTQDVPADALPLFHGVPCTIKEAFGLTGMPNSSGLLSRKDIISSGDATAVARLRAAGAIPLGVTNVPELCMWMETHNRVYGRTNNPYHPRRIAGGSSGGEGAIIGAGGSPFGLGSDIGGSIRMPAFFNGVCGHKPTGGMVPATGQYPIAENEALRYLTTGPLCRRAEDLMPLLAILAGPDGMDPACREFTLGDPAGVDIGTLKVLLVPDNGSVPVGREIREIQERCGDFLSRRGAKVETVRIEGLRKSLDIWSAMLSAARGTPFGTLLGNGKPIRPLPELAKLAGGRSSYTLPAVVLSLLEKLTALTPKRTEKFVRLGRELQAELVDRIGPGGIMLYPPYPRTAPPHRQPLLAPFRFVYTAIINVLELPATQVPLGLSPGGLPLGIQVIGSPGNDHLTIATALELEKEFGGWVPPPLAEHR